MSHAVGLHRTLGAPDGHTSSVIVGGISRRPVLTRMRLKELIEGACGLEELDGIAA